MVNDLRPTGSRYVVGTDGAPPIPPEGGYHGARRGISFPIESAPLPADEDFLDEDPRTGWFGIVALVVASVFALILIIAVIAQASDFMYGVNMIAAQVAVLGIVVAALFTQRGRKLASIALTITLLVNIATMGGLGALRSAATGTYQNHTSDEDKRWQKYPGVKGYSESEILGQSSLEETRTHAEDVMSAIRSALTAEFGFTWSNSTPEDLRPARNGYGGESMLVDYTSSGWFTNEPIRGTSQKYAVMDAIDRVLSQYDHATLRSLNDPSSSGLNKDVLTRMFGSADPATQVQWEWYSYDYDTPSRMYADITDLGNDTTGSFRTAREAMHQKTGEPLEGLQLMFVSERMLSEKDRDEFQKRMKDYP